MPKPKTKQKTQKQIREQHYKNVRERVIHAWEEYGGKHHPMCAWDMYQIGAKCICGAKDAKDD